MIKIIIFKIASPPRRQREPSRKTLANEEEDFPAISTKTDAIMCNKVESVVVEESGKLIELSKPFVV